MCFDEMGMSAESLADFCVAFMDSLAALLGSRVVIRQSPVMVLDVVDSEIIFHVSENTP